MAKIADLFIDLHLDTSAFTKELRTALAAASSKDVKISVKADTRSASRSVKGLDRDVQKATTGLNKYTGRLALVGDALLALTPAAVGVGAVAVPVLAAFSTAIADAGVAAGTAIIAFKGVGTALTSISKAKLDPSITNLQAMSLALSALSPAARQFTIYLSSLSGELDKMRQSAGADLFPGLEVGIQAASSRLPQINSLLHEFGGILGDIGARLGEAFASDRYDVLFRLLRTSGKTTLEDLFRSVENVTHGVIELVAAFAPLNKGGFDWMVTVTKNFDDWATGLKKTQGFKDFLAYVQQTGPEVASAVEAIAEAFIAIAKAAAPLSGPVLKAITGIADVLAAIANSPVGPILFQAALAMRLFARSTALLGPAAAAASKGFASLNMAVLDFRTTSAATGGFTGALGRSLKGFGSAAKAAAGPAGILAIADSATRTQGPLRSLEAAAGGAALGFSVGGPWGAAIGGGLGLLTSFIGGTKEAVISLDDLTDTLNKNTGAITSQSMATIASALNDAGIGDSVKSLGLNLDTVTNAAVQGGPALSGLNSQLDDIISKGTKFTYSTYGSTKSISAQAKAAQDLKDKLASTSSTISDALSKGKIQASVNKAVARSTNQLARGEITAAQAAHQQATAENAATAALHSKHAATLANFDATTAYGQALANARKQAAKNTKGLNENTEGGRANRAALSQLASGWDNLSEKAKAAPGAFAKAKASFIDVARGMDIPIGKARQLANQLLDLPNPNLKVRLDNAQALSAARAVAAEIAALRDKTIRLTTIRSTGGRLLPGAATGGMIHGPGTATSDSIPARLSDGEYVIRAAAVSKYGRGFMGRVNAMRFAAGGAADKKKVREIFGTASLRDFANGLKKGFDASAVYKELHKIIQHDLSGQAERNQLRLLGHMGKTLDKIHDISKKVDQARQRLQNARAARNDFRTSFAQAVGPTISELGSAPGGIAGGLRGKLHLVRAFVRNLKRLGAKKFLPRALLAQVAQLGPVDGNNAALQLLALSDKQLRAVGGDFRALDTFAKSQSKVLGKAYYNADIAGAKAHLTQMQADQRHYNRIFENAADAFATQLAHRLNVNLNPHKKKPKGTHDAGGWLDVGSSLVSNQTGRPEAVYTQDQWQRMDRLVTALERGGTTGRAGTPLIGHADIHHEVDLDRYERQRAFRDRMTRIGG